MILATGWTVVDPIVSIAIALLIVASAWGVLRDSTAILMEETPTGIDADAVARAIVSVPGVTSIHDLHVWRITSGFDALAAHVLVGRGEDCHGLRREIERTLESQLRHHAHDPAGRPRRFRRADRAEPRRASTQLARGSSTGWQAPARAVSWPPDGRFGYASVFTNSTRSSPGPS